MSSLSPPPRGDPLPVSAWPPQAQMVLALSVAVCLVLVAYQGYQHTSWACHPSRIEPRPTTVDLPRPSPETETGLTPPAGMPSRKADTLVDLVDVNHDSSEQLQQLPGIGPKMAQRIVDERKRAPFRTVEELRRVSGIGPKVLDKLRPYVQLSREPKTLASLPTDGMP